MNRCNLFNKKTIKQYESWVINRINDKQAFCHLYRGHKCIPSHDESCMSCYRTCSQKLDGTFIEK
jgi:hypothetical protein